MQLNKTIHKPIITEKSTALKGTQNRFVFKVNKNASKSAITKSLKELFDVDVTEVRTMVMPGKKRRIGRTRNFTKTKSWKKAVVTLKDGQNIDLFPEGN